MKLALFAILLCFTSGLCQASEVYVFVPTKIKARVIAKSLSVACSGTQITVFGRVKDFMDQVAANSPATILTLIPTIEHNSSYKVVLAGEKDGEKSESYLFVSVDTPFDIANLATSKIGVVDILGRNPMLSYLSEKLGSKVKLARVVKQEDLLTLLRFNSADALLISENTYKSLLATSQLNLVTTPLDFRIGLASLASTSGMDIAAIVRCFKLIDSETRTALGVDQWVQQ